MTASIALRELWISFRLLTVIGLFAITGVLAAVAPLLTAAGLAPPGSAISWYTGALIVAAAGSAAVAAAAFAGERRRGGLAWMAARAVPRSLLLLGWFAALLAAMLAGLVPSALLAWLSLSAENPFLAREGSALAFGLTVAAATADALAWLSAGLLAGTLLVPRLASALTLLMVSAVLLVAGLAPSLAPLLPAGGVALLAEFGTAPVMVGGLQAAGVGLLWSSVLIGVAIAALARRDL